MGRYDSINTNSHLFATSSFHAQRASSMPASQRETPKISTTGGVWKECLNLLRRCWSAGHDSLIRSSPSQLSGASLNFGEPSHASPNLLTAIASTLKQTSPRLTVQLCPSHRQVGTRQSQRGLAQRQCVAPQTRICLLISTSCSSNVKPIRSYLSTAMTLRHSHWLNGCQIRGSREVKN